jgi:N-acetylneuraminic acid mutarotase
MAAGWTESIDMPDARNHYQGILLGDYIYTAGGQYRHDTNPQDLDLFHRFHWINNTWEQLATLPTPKSHAETSTMIINGRIVQVGGRNNNNAPGHDVLDTVTEYDPQTNTWQYLRSIGLRSTTPSAGFFPNITIGGVRGDYLVYTAGGVDYNAGKKDTFVSLVTWNCTFAPIIPATGKYIY